MITVQLYGTLYGTVYSIISLYSVPYTAYRRTVLYTPDSVQSYRAYCGVRRTVPYTGYIKEYGTAQLVITENRFQCIVCAAASVMPWQRPHRRQRGLSSQKAESRIAVRNVELLHQSGRTIVSCLVYSRSTGCDCALVLITTRGFKGWFMNFRTCAFICTHGTCPCVCRSIEGFPASLAREYTRRACLQVCVCVCCVQSVHKYYLLLACESQAQTRTRTKGHGHSLTRTNARMNT